MSFANQLDPHLQQLRGPQPVEPYETAEQRMWSDSRGPLTGKPKSDSAARMAALKAGLDLFDAWLIDNGGTK